MTSTPALTLAQTNANGRYVSQSHPLPQSGFCGVNILVIGDLMLDRYIDGEVHRISPEAPIPVLTVHREWMFAGGAANVALNVAGLNAKVAVAGVMGEDSWGCQLRDILAHTHVDARCVIMDSSRPTTRKTRVMSGNHQIVRLDEECCDSLRTQLQDELLEKIMLALSGTVDAVVLSDYAKGVLADPCPQIIISECKRRGIPLLVDPKRRDFRAYVGATCITPNHKEFRVAASDMSMGQADISVAGPALREQLDCQALLITQGSNGMTLVTREHCRHLPAIAEEVFDVSGAGDTVIATLTVALAAGFPLLPAVELANAAAGIVVKHAGTTPIAWRDLFGSIKPSGT